MKMTRATHWAIGLAILLLGAEVASAGGWHRTLDLPGYQASERTRDGGLVAVGGAPEVVKLDATGAVVWSTRYGGATGLWRSIAESDVGYVVAGDGGVGNDVVVAELGRQRGAIRWIRFLNPHTVGPASIHAVAPTDGGGYVIAGSVEIPPALAPDAWVVKLNATGNVVWSRTYGTIFEERVNAIQETPDGGLIVAGKSSIDLWLAKLDAAGDPQWQKSYRVGDQTGFYPSEAYAVRPLAGGGYWVAGEIGSISAGRTVAWVLRVNDDGQIQWQRPFSGGPPGPFPEEVDTFARDLYPTLDDGVVVAGGFSSIGVPSGTWLLRVASSGAELWQKRLDPMGSWATDVRPTPDGGFLVAAHTEDGLTFHLWKLDDMGEADPACGVLSVGGDIAPPPVTVGDVVDTGTSLAVDIWDFGPVTSFDWSLPTTVECGFPADPFEEDDGCMVAEATLLGGDSQAHNFADDDTDWLRFHACPGRSYILATANLGSEADTVLGLYGPDCATLLASDDNGGGGLASRIDWTATADGVYYLKVAQADHTPGLNRTYEVSLTGDTSPCGEWVISYGPNNIDLLAVEETPDGGLVMAGAIQSDLSVVKLDAAGSVEWHRSYGGDELETPGALQPTADGGYIVAASTFSYGAGDYDYWLLKLDANGDIAWQRCYGAAGRDEARSVVQTTDGGYAVAGQTTSFGAGSETWVLKLDATGAVQWQKRYGGVDGYWPKTIRQTADGGYLVAGGTYSSTNDAWVMKVDEQGAIQWQRAVGTASHEYPEAMALATDGGHVLVGIVDGMIWVTKLDFLGNWERGWTAFDTTLPYPQDLQVRSVRRTVDGGFIVTGTSQRYLFLPPYFDFDGLVLRFDAEGIPEWIRSYDEPLDVNPYLDLEMGRASAPTADGGFVALLGGSANVLLRPGSEGWIGDCDWATDGQVGMAFFTPDVTVTTAVATTTTAAVANTTAVAVERPITAEQLCPLTLPDTDGDGVPDGTDNCTEDVNPDQLDTDGDGIGNVCDCDFNQDDFCGGPDFTLFIGCFNQPTGGDATCEAADMNGDGFVGGPDFTLFIGGFNGPPGPAAP